MPCECGRSWCAIEPFVVRQVDTTGWTWFASVGIIGTHWFTDEWLVNFPGMNARWVAADGEARERHLINGTLIPQPTEWHTPPRPTLTLTTPTMDPVPLPVRPPSRADLQRRRDADDDEPTCAGCDEAPDECACTTCTACNKHERDLEICSACEECTDCCACVGCSYRRCAWRGSAEEQCGTCERCNDHCDCMYCEGCCERVREGYCSECDRCVDCCTCESNGETPAHVSYKTPTFHTAKRGEHKRNPSRRMLAVEIEVAGTDGENNRGIEQACKKWRASITSDGSLPDEGFEIPTAPASGDVFCKQIEDICGELRKADGKVDASCGLHVHVDARDFSHYDLRRLVMLYAKVERALFETQPQSRRDNHYCQPCGETLVDGLREARVPKVSKHALMANVYKVYKPRVKTCLDRRGKVVPTANATIDLRDARQDKYHDARYSALNLHSWVYRGTVECRLHTGSLEPKKIIAWAMLLAAMLDYALATTEREVEALTFPTLADEQRFLHDVIAPTEEVKAYLRARWAQFGKAFVPSETSDIRKAG